MKMDENWQDGKTLSECNLYMLTNEIACDVTFLVGQEEEVVMAHSFILESRAAKLRKLYADQKKFVSKLVILQDVKAEPFRLMLRYLYAGDLDLTTKQALSLIPVIDRYGPVALKKKCFEQILAEITSDNACDILEKCHAHDEKVFFDKCLHFIHINAVEVMASRSFSRLCRDCLGTIVKAEELNTDELSVFNALLSWADSQCCKRKYQITDANKRHMLGNLIFHVRFGTMAISEFTEKVSTRDVLVSDEKIKIFQYHHGNKTKLPAHFVLKPRKVYKDTSDHIGLDRINKRKSSVSLAASIPKNSNKTLAVDSLENLLKVNRFQIVKGAWKNNGPDAISFRCSVTIILRGIQVYSSYKKTKGFNDVEVAIFDQNGSEIQKEKYPLKCEEESRLNSIIFTEPVRVQAGEIFTVQTYSRGSPVHCGSKGITSVYVDDARFDFLPSCKSPNGTDVTMGQIPTLLFTKE